MAQFSVNDAVRLGIEILDNAARTKPTPSARSRKPARSETRGQARSSGNRSAYDRSTVAEVQRTLNELGYSAGPVDGMMGPQTSRAIAAFQRSAGLSPTGMPDAALLGTLRSVESQGGIAWAPEERGAPTAPFDAATNTHGQPPTAAPAEFAILPDYDLPNGDYRSGMTDPQLEGISTAECQELCAADGRCRAFTYNTKASVCILKDSVPEQKPFAGAISGIKAAGVAPGGGPAAEMGMKDGIPTLNGRLLVRGPALWSGMLADDAAAQFRRMAVYAVLKRFPGVLEDESNAREALTYLDDASRQAVIATAGVDSEKVVGYWGNLDEFERRSLLHSVGTTVPPIAAARAPDLPIPVIILCSISIGDYDFDRQQFPIERADDCNAIDLAGFGNVSIAAPVPTAYIPNHVAVPLDRARDFKRGLVRPGRDDVPVGDLDLAPDMEPVLGIEAQLTGMGERRSDDNYQNKRQFEFGIKVEGALLFRQGDVSRPVAKLPLVGTSSVDTVSVAPTGPVRLDDDAVSLLLLARNATDFGDAEFADWARRRAYRESSGHPGAWATFFREQIADRLTSGTPPEPELLANFAEWNRARASGMPETLNVQTQHSTLDWLLWEALPGGVRVFDEPDASAFAAVTPRLKVASSQLFTPATLDFSNGLAGLGPAEVVLVLPAARDEFTVRIDPDAETGGDLLDVTVEFRVRDVRVDRMEGQLPLVALYVEPVKAHVTAQSQPRAEIASASFNQAHPEGTALVSGGASQTANPAVDVAMPFKAEAMDLLQLRYLPETVDDGMIALMMTARHDYEEDLADLGETPLGGWFFRDLSKPLDEAERARRLAEFRDWSTARADALPETLTLSLELRNGKAPFEDRGESPSDSACQTASALAGARTAGSTERDAMAAKLCAFLAAAWASPEPLLYYEEHLADSGGIGPRYDCGGERYCGEYAGYYARSGLGLPPATDLVRLDQLPVLDEATRKREGELVLEIDVAPSGVTPITTWPDSIWRQANRRARPFDEAHGLRIVVEPEETTLAGPAFIFEAKTLAARVVDTEAGEMIAEPPLAAQVPLPDTLLETSASSIRAFDMLGIRLGTTFEEAERLIREHMEVGQVLGSDRASQLSAASGQIEPYTSGRLFISKAQNELIAIFDEPPAAPGTVLGMWRILHMPKGQIDPAGLKAMLTDRYGPPSATEQASAESVTFVWQDFKHENTGCGRLDQQDQSQLWREEGGAAVEPSPFMNRWNFPILGSAYHFEPTLDGESPHLSLFCPPVLGVRYTTYPAVPGSEARADEIVTWLNDQRSYAELFFKSRTAASAQSAAPAHATPKIKF